MCGIAGYVNYNEGPSKKIILKMADSISYRGPDSAGFFLDSKVALGVRRLRVIDIATGEQPIYNENRSAVIIFNGEIYNFKELRKELLKEGHKFKTQSDTEVIVHLYEKHQESCPKYLNGMFGFAIWNRKKQSLFLARDHAGIKPMFYYHKAGLFIFASEIKAILTHPNVRREIDREALAMYFALGYFPGERTIYQNIYKLPAGHSLLFSGGRKKISRYWTIENGFSEQEGDLEEILEDAVGRQMVADVPVGVLLSGGVDSSLITYYAAKHKKNLRTYSIAFSQKEFDESKYARIVSERFGTKHTEEIFNPGEIQELFPKMIKLLDEPNADATIFPTFKVCKLARKQVTVALSGEGGDELFGGYDAHRAGFLNRLPDYFPKTFAKLTSGFGTSLPISSTFYKRSPAYQKYFSGVPLPLISRHLFWSTGTNSYKVPEIIAGLQKERFYGRLQDDFARYNWTLGQKLQYVDFSTILTDELLVKSDRASMYNSLELRVPLLDSRIINYCFTTKRIHANRRGNKRLLRELLNLKLPGEIINRPKKGFTIPLSGWVRSELYDLVNERLNYRKIYDFLNEAEVVSAYNKHQNRIENHARFIWAVTMFSGWLENWY